MILIPKASKIYFVHTLYFKLIYSNLHSDNNRECFHFIILHYLLFLRNNYNNDDDDYDDDERLKIPYLLIIILEPFIPNM